MFSSKDPMLSSKASSASATTDTNFCVHSRRCALGVSIVDFLSDMMELQGNKRIHCFDLRTQWYSHQSNRLMNWLIQIWPKNRKI